MLALIPRNLVQTNGRLVFNNANATSLEDTRLCWVQVGHDKGLLFYNIVAMNGLNEQRLFVGCIIWMMPIERRISCRQQFDFHKLICFDSITFIVLNGFGYINVTTD